MPAWHGELPPQHGQRLVAPAAGSEQTSTSQQMSSLAASRPSVSAGPLVRTDNKAVGSAPQSQWKCCRISLVKREMQLGVCFADDLLGLQALSRPEKCLLARMSKAASRCNVRVCVWRQPLSAAGLWLVSDDIAGQGSV